MRRFWRRGALATASLAVVFLVYLWVGLPSRQQVRVLAKQRPGPTGVMQQRAAEAEKAGRKARVLQDWVPLSRISKNLIQAVVTAEDDSFFGHEGVNWDAIKDSLEKDWQKRRFARGGSTITQQLAKNLFFSTYKSPIRKLRELVVVRWLEQDLSKARILELYLNVIEWGDGVYGCEAAARRYYGKSAAELNASEAAGLAAMIPNPRRINPRVNAARHARATRRVLWLMSRAGYVRKDATGLGAPPPDEVEDDSGPEPSEPEAEPTPSASPTPPVTPEPAATPEPTLGISVE